MFSRYLLCALLVHSTVGAKNEGVDVVENLNDPDCKKRLNPQLYSGPDNELSTANGNPHYMWGLGYTSDKLLYCAKVKSDSTFQGKYSLVIPKHVLRSIINVIEVTDRKWPDFKGGNVDLEVPNDYSRYVALNFQPVKDKPMEYMVIILGKPLHKAIKV